MAIYIARLGVGWLAGCWRGGVVTSSVILRLGVALRLPGTRVCAPPRLIFGPFQSGVLAFKVCQGREQRDGKDTGRAASQCNAICRGRRRRVCKCGRSNTACRALPYTSCQRRATPCPVVAAAGALHVDVERAWFHVAGEASRVCLGGRFLLSERGVAAAPPLCIACVSC